VFLFKNLFVDSSFPEERERYWNAYILFYDKIDKNVTDKDEDGKLGRTNSKRSVSMSCSPAFSTKKYK